MVLMYQEPSGELSLVVSFDIITHSFMNSPIEYCILEEALAHTLLHYVYNF